MSPKWGLPGLEMAAVPAEMRAQTSPQRSSVSLVCLLVCKLLCFCNSHVLNGKTALFLSGENANLPVFVTWGFEMVPRLFIATCKTAPQHVGLPYQHSCSSLPSLQLGQSLWETAHLYPTGRQWELKVASLTVLVLAGSGSFTGGAG